MALTAVFACGSLTPPAAAQTVPAVMLPPVGTMVHATAAYQPVNMLGLTIRPENPLQLDFIIDSGQSGLAAEGLKAQSAKLINYFLTALTLPEDQLWVNLSPYEKERIIPDSLSRTEMGRDMLAQDYLLKQLTASLMYPEDELGRRFWQRVMQQSYQRYGTTELPANTFNKIWIIPEYAHVFKRDGSVFVVDSHLSVMLEEDYLAKEGHSGEVPGDTDAMDEATKELIREIMIPEIEREINQGENFAKLRQIFNAMILAVWYKKNLKESLLGRIYADRNLVKGVDHVDPALKQEIYDQYIAAFRKGVFNYVKEDIDPVSHAPVPRKYFSGGVAGIDQAQIGEVQRAPVELLAKVDSAYQVRANLTALRPADAAILADRDGEPEWKISERELEDLLAEPDFPLETKFWHALEFLDRVRHWVADENFIDEDTLQVYRRALLLVEPPRQYDDRTLLRAEARGNLLHDLYLRQLEVLAEMADSTQRLLAMEPEIMLEDLENRILRGHPRVGMLTSTQYVSVKTKLMKLLSDQNRVQHIYDRIAVKYPVREYERTARAVQLWEKLVETDRDLVDYLIVLDKESMPAGIEAMGLIPEARTLVVSEEEFMNAGHHRSATEIEDILTETQTAAVTDAITARRSINLQQSRERLETLRESMRPIFTELLGEGVPMPRFAYLRPSPTALVIEMDNDSLQAVREASRSAITSQVEATDLDRDIELSDADAARFRQLQRLLRRYPEFVFINYHDELIAYLTGGLLRTYAVDGMIDFYRRNYQNALYSLIDESVTDPELRAALIKEAKTVLSDANPIWTQIEAGIRENKAMIDRLVDKRASLIISNVTGGTVNLDEAMDDVQRLLLEHRAYREASHELRAVLQFIPPGKMSRLSALEARFDDEIRIKKSTTPRLAEMEGVGTKTMSRTTSSIGGFARFSNELPLIVLGMGKSVWVREHEVQHVINNGFTLYNATGLRTPGSFRALWRRVLKGETVADEAMTVSEVLQGFLPEGRTPERTQVGRFQIVHAPWRTSPDKPDNYFEHVVMPFDESQFFFGTPAAVLDVDWRFDEGTVFWEGQLDGTELAFIEQRWPYALNHFLIVPQRAGRRPQVLTGEDVRLMIDITRAEPLPGFRLAFNSLKAGASINHLHWHGLTVPGDTSALEQAGLVEVTRDGEVTVSRVQGYGANGLFFSGGDSTATAASAYTYIKRLQERDIAHAVIVTPRGLYVMPVHGNIITSYGMTWSFYELMGFIVNSDPDRDFSWVREEHIRTEMKEVVLTDEEFGATYRDLWSRDTDAAALAAGPVYGQAVDVLVRPDGLRIDGRPLANGLPDARHDLKHIAFAEVNGGSSVLDHLTYGAYSTRAWDDFTFREGIHAGNMEEIFVRAMEVYLSADGSATPDERLAAIETDLGKPLGDLPPEFGVSLTEGSRFRQALAAYTRLERQLEMDGEVRWTHRYAPSFLKPAEGDAAMTAAEHAEQRANVGRIYQAMAENFDITVGEPAFQDSERVAAMAGMFPAGPDGRRQAVETDIYSVALMQLPQGMRDWLRDVLVADWLSIFEDATEDIDHFIPERDTYHVSVSVVQDVAAHQDEAVGVLGRPEERLSQVQREQVTADLRRIIASKPGVTLIPVGARVGPDGTLIFVFEYDPVLYEIRSEAVDAVRARHAAFTGRPKPMVHITLSRTLTNPDVTPQIKKKWDAFAARYRTVSAADMGLDGPVAVSELEFSHERRWMHTDIGATEVMPFAGEDQAELAQFHPFEMLGLIALDGQRLKAAVEAQEEFNAYDAPLDLELARLGFTREMIIEEIVAKVEQRRTLDRWAATDALEHILREVLENAVDAYMQRADFDDEFMFGFDVRSHPRGTVIRFLDNGTPLFVSETSEEKRALKKTFHNRYGGKHAGMTIIRHQVTTHIHEDAEVELIDLSARFPGIERKLEFFTMLEILLPEDGAVLSEVDRGALPDETPLEELGFSAHSQRILRQRGLLTLGVIKELHRNGGLNEIAGMKSPLSKVRIEIDSLMLDLISAPDQSMLALTDQLQTIAEVFAVDKQVVADAIASAVNRQENPGLLWQFYGEMFRLFDRYEIESELAQLFMLTHLFEQSENKLEFRLPDEPLKKLLVSDLEMDAESAATVAMVIEFDALLRAKINADLIIKAIVNSRDDTHFAQVRAGEQPVPRMSALEVARLMKEQDLLRGIAQQWLQVYGPPADEAALAEEKLSPVAVFLKGRREARDLSHYQMNRLGLGQASRIERDETVPEIRTIRKYAQLLDFSGEELSSAFESLARTVYPNPRASLGAFLGYHRIRNGMTARTLIDDHNYIHFNNYEHNKVVPEVYILKRLSALLGMTEDDFAWMRAERAKQKYPRRLQNLADYIAYWRNSQGLTQDDVIAQGISRIRVYETGNQVPRLDTLRQLDQVLGWNAIVARQLRHRAWWQKDLPVMTPDGPGVITEVRDGREYGEGVHVRLDSGLELTYIGPSLARILARDTTGADAAVLGTVPTLGGSSPLDLDAFVIAVGETYQQHLQGAWNGSLRFYIPFNDTYRDFDDFLVNDPRDGRQWIYLGAQTTSNGDKTEAYLARIKEVTPTKIRFDELMIQRATGFIPVQTLIDQGFGLPGSADMLVKQAEHYMRNMRPVMLAAISQKIAEPRMVLGAARSDLGDDMIYLAVPIVDPDISPATFEGMYVSVRDNERFYVPMHAAGDRGPHVLVRLPRLIKMTQRELEGLTGLMAERTFIGRGLGVEKIGQALTGAGISLGGEELELDVDRAVDNISAQDENKTDKAWLRQDLREALQAAGFIADDEFSADFGEDSAVLVDPPFLIGISQLQVADIARNMVSDTFTGRRLGYLRVLQGLNDARIILRLGRRTDVKLDLVVSNLYELSGEAIEKAWIERDLNTALRGIGINLDQAVLADTQRYPPIPRKEFIRFFTESAWWRSVTGRLEQFRAEGLIHSYGVTGSFSRGQYRIHESKDLDLALVLKSGAILKSAPDKLLRYIAAVNADKSIPLHITLTAFGPSYDYDVATEELNFELVRGADIVKSHLKAGAYSGDRFIRLTPDISRPENLWELHRHLVELGPLPEDDMLRLLDRDGDQAVLADVLTAVRQNLRRDEAYAGRGNEHLPEYLRAFQERLLFGRSAPDRKFIDELLDFNTILTVSEKTPLYNGSPLNTANPVVWGNDSQIFMQPTRSIHLYPGDLRLKGSGGANLLPEFAAAPYPYVVREFGARARSIYFGANEQNLQQEMTAALSFAYLMETLWPGEGAQATNIPLGIKRVKTVSVDGESYPVEVYFQKLAREDEAARTAMEELLTRQLGSRRSEYPQDTAAAFVAFMRPAQMLDMQSSPLRLGLIRNLLLEDYSSVNEIDDEVRARWARWGAPLEGQSAEQIAALAKQLVDDVFTEIMEDYRPLDIPVAELIGEEESPFAVLYQAAGEYRRRILIYNARAAERFYRDVVIDLGRYLGALWTVGGRTDGGPIEERNVAIRRNRVILHDWDEGFVPNRETMGMNIAPKGIRNDFDMMRVSTLSTIQQLLGVDDRYADSAQRYFRQGIDEGSRRAMEEILLNPDQKVLNDIDRQLLLSDWRRQDVGLPPGSRTGDQSAAFVADFIRAVGEWARRGEMVVSDQAAFADLAADTRLISEIEPIERVARFVTDIEDFDGLVEPPLREAVRALFKKGIRTFWASANRKDIAEGSPAVLMFLYDELSPHNKRVARSVGQVLENISTIVRIPMTADTTVADVHRAAMAIVDRFEKQPLDRSIAEIVRPGQDEAMTAEAARLAGAAFIFGTGNNASVIDARGNIITEGGALTELGHNILRKARTGEWVFTGRQTLGDRPKREQDDVSFEDSFSGPNIARRFAQNYYAIDFLRRYVPQLPAEFANHAQMVTLVRDNPGDEASRKLRAVGIDVILRAVTQAVARRDARAISFVNRLGRDIGYALSAWLQHYAHEPWAENIVMVSGVGEHFARIEGQSDDSNVFIGGIRAGVILGLSRAREAGDLPGLSDQRIRTIARGIRRSTMGWERELLAARFTDEEKQAFASDEEAGQPLAVGISLGGTKIGSGLISARGDILQQGEVRWRQRYHESSAGIVEGIVDEIMARLNPNTAGRLRKIGIAFAGPVDRAGGIVGTPFKAPNLPFENFDLAKAVRERLADKLQQDFGITRAATIVDIYNDNVAAAIGEQSRAGSLSVSPEEEQEPETDEAMRASVPKQQRAFDTVKDISSVFPYAGLINLQGLAQSGVQLTNAEDHLPPQTSVENYVLKARHELKIREGGEYRGAVPLWEYRKPGQLVNIPLEKFTDARWVLPLHAQYRPRLTENQGLVRTLMWLYLVSKPELQGEKIVAIGGTDLFRRTLDDMRAVFGDYRTITADDFGFPLSNPAYEFTVPVLTAEQQAALKAYLDKFMPIADTAMMSHEVINDENQRVSIRPILERMAGQLKAYTGLLRMGRLKFELGRPPYMRYRHKQVSVTTDHRDGSLWVTFDAEQDHSTPIEADYITDEVRRALFTGLRVMVKVDARTGSKITWGDVMIRGQQGYIPLHVLGEMEGVSTQLLTHWIHTKINGLLRRDERARGVLLDALEKPSMDLLAARNIDGQPIIFMEYPNDAEYAEPNDSTTQEFRFEQPDREIIYVTFQRLEADAAMTADDPGGIDLNPVNMKLQEDGETIPMNLTPAVPVPSGTIEGLRPVIIHIVPVTNLPLLLGLTDIPTDEDADEDSEILARDPADRRELSIAALDVVVN